MSSDANGAPKKENLFDYTEEQLLQEDVLTHYQILGIEEHTSSDGVKKAYRKASLKYVNDVFVSVPSVWLLTMTFLNIMLFFLNLDVTDIIPTKQAEEMTIMCSWLSKKHMMF